MTHFPVWARLAALLPLISTLNGQDDLVFHGGTELIEVYATVRDHQNRYIDELKPDSFLIFEDGRSQSLASFEGPTEGVSCALVLDTTGSMERALPSLRNSAAHFIDQLGSNDSIAIYTFAQRLERRQEFTTDRAAAKRAVMRTRAAGKTALFDALSETAREVAERPGKKAIVVFTDGGDNASVLTSSGAVGRLRKLGIPLFAIAEGEALDSRPLLKTLQEICRQTGGAANAVRKLSDVDRVFDLVSQDLQHTYLLTYKPPKSDAKSWRAISVKVVNADDLRVRAREGYFPD